jgi:hypothetical protein
MGLGLALLVGCGSTARGLIPSGASGPLLADFEEVQRAAESAGGNCTATEAAIKKTELDYAALPVSLNAGLRANLRQGIENLGVRARELCSQPRTQTSTTSTTSTPPPTKTTPTTPTTPTTTTPTTPHEENEAEAKEPSGPGGAPSEEKHENPGGAESGASG